MSAGSKRWKRAEKRVASRLGMTLTPASGGTRMASKKADMANYGVARAEAKSTAARRFKVTARMLDKLCRQAAWNEEVIFTVTTRDLDLALVPTDAEADIEVKSSYTLGPNDIGRVITFTQARMETTWEVKLLGKEGLR